VAGLEVIVQNKIFSDKEIDKKRNMQKLHIPNSDKPVDFYSL